MGELVAEAPHPEEVAPSRVARRPYHVVCQAMNAGSSSSRWRTSVPPVVLHAPLFFPHLTRLGIEPGGAGRTGFGLEKVLFCFGMPRHGSRPRWVLHRVNSGKAAE